MKYIYTYIVMVFPSCKFVCIRKSNENVFFYKFLSIYVLFITFQLARKLEDCNFVITYM